MPIKNLTEQLRMPRLGKIHLGVKKLTAKGVEYPTATDYFVCPDEVKKVYGDKPKQLPIMIPTEDSEYWASQYYRAYSQTRGLICRGDGEIYHRMVDIETKEIAGKDTKNVAWVAGVCAGQDCPIYQDKKCSEMMCLQFMLPDVPGVGVWQVDTGSINSIRNINSEAHLIRQLCGHISMLPLLLTLEPEDKQIPETGKKRQLYFLHLRERDTLQSLLRDSQRPVFELLAPPVDEAQAARDIEELWPEEKTTTPPVSTSEKSTPETSEGQAETRPASEMVGFINMTDLNMSLKTLQDREVKAYSSKNILSYLNAITGSKLDTIPAVIAKLSREQAEAFVKKVSDALEMS